MSILDDPKFMDKVRAADTADKLPEFLNQVTRVVRAENRVLARAQHARESLERYNRMARARGLPEKTSL